MKTGGNQELDETVFKWYVQQKACGTQVTSESIQNACEQIGKHLSIECSASDGWLWRFRNRHGLRDTQLRGEAGSADTAGTKVYRVKLNELIRKKVFLCLRCIMPMKLACFGVLCQIILRQLRMKK